MPKQSLTKEELLQFLSSKQLEEGKEHLNFLSFKELLDGIQKQYPKATERTLYRRLGDLRRENLIQQLHTYQRKFRQRKDIMLDGGVIIVDENDERVEVDGRDAIILEDAGEIRVLTIEITREGKEQNKNH